MIRVLKKNVFTLYLHKVLIKCRLFIGKLLNITEKSRTRKILKAVAEEIKKNKNLFAATTNIKKKDC